MGEIIRLKCTECQCGGHFKIGAGMMSADPDMVDQYLGKEDKQIWERLRSQDAIQFSTWKYVLAYCKECRKMQSSFSVDVQTKEEKHMVLGNRCSQCERKLEPVKWKKDMFCPSCGKIFAVNELTGRWD